MPAPSEAARRFVLHWGEMGTRWGVNRTVAQIHALLYVAPEPLNAEQIAAALGIARSNVSNSLRELQNWGLVRVVHHMGDRRDHFQTLGDVWEMFQIVLDERKKREVDPTLGILRDCLSLTRKGSPDDAHVRKRLEAMLEFFETMTGWYQQISRMPAGAVVKFIRLGRRVPKLLGIGTGAS